MQGTSVEEIQSVVKDFIMREFLPDEDPNELQNDTPLISDGIIDSIAALKLVAFIEETYGIEINKIREIIRMGQITQVPETPHFIKGLINLRSTVIPVIDLRARFGLPEEELTDESRIMVLNVGSRTIGIIVDAVSEVLRVTGDQISEAPPTVSSLGNEYMTGLVRLEEQLLILLDVDQLFGKEQLSEVDNAAGAA